MARKGTYSYLKNNPASLLILRYSFTRLRALTVKIVNASTELRSIENHRHYRSRSEGSVELPKRLTVWHNSLRGQDGC